MHRIYDDHAYFLDTDKEMAVFEYKIVEKVEKYKLDPAVYGKQC